MRDVGEAHIEDSRRARWLAVALAISALGVAACGDGDDGNKSGAATTRTPDRKPIVIRTELNLPAGKILRGSSLGGSAFCPGGTLHDEPGSPAVGTVLRNIRCANGTLRIGFSPNSGTVAKGPWKLLDGTGAYQGLRGDGQMVARFEKDGRKGRETFTGTVTR
jgi:hypothetical protein